MLEKNDAVPQTARDITSKKQAYPKRGEIYHNIPLIIAVKHTGAR